MDAIQAIMGRRSIRRYTPEPVSPQDLDTKELFRLPETVVPFCIIALGHPGEEKPPANRYDAARIHSNTW